jgi:tripartite ATP-independent transporter DctM subunit
VFVVLTVISVPLAVSGGVASSIALLLFNEEFINPLMTIIQKMQFGVDNYTLLAIPLFILCGTLMNTSGITDRIFNLAQVMVGFVPGGLAHANVVASIIFAGMSGSMVGDAGGLGQVEIKAMRDRGYPAAFSCAVTAASSTIGPVIPPSVTMLLISGITQLSPGKLFLGGIIPGFLMGFSLMILIFILATKQDLPRTPKPTFREILTALRRATLPILTPVIIVGGIAGGVFAVTEAAAVACLYAVILGFVVYKELKLRDLPKVLLSTMQTTAQIMFIVATVAGISYILIHQKFTETVGHFIFTVTTQPWLILLMFNVLVLLLGALIEGAALILLIVPIFMPLMEQIGIDPIHFGIFMAINVLIGGITPPIGMALFVISGVARVKVERLFTAIIPFLIPLIAVLFLVTYVEPISMAIPRWLMGN